jgi:hypothetical protein
MVKVSVALGSSRPGGVDISLIGLANQTFKDFEVIFVDGRYYKRHGKVLDFVKKTGLKQPFYHVPNHRYNGIWSVNCAGVNTGFMLSEGEIVIMLLDYAYTPPEWIENHLKYHDKRRLVMAPHLYTEMPEVVTKDGGKPLFFPFGGEQTTVENILRQKENFDEISIFKSFYNPNWIEKLKVLEPPDTDPKAAFPTGPIAHTYMHTKNESFPLSVVLDIGGIDENFDRGRGAGDTEFGFRFVCAGCETWLSNEAHVFCHNPREILPNLNVTTPISWKGTPTQPRWSYDEGMSYANRRVAEISSGQPPVAKNPYDMHEKRKEIWHWRELSQEEDPLIPMNDISNEEYFK